MCGDNTETHEINILICMQMIEPVNFNLELTLATCSIVIKDLRMLILRTFMFLF